MSDDLPFVLDFLRDVRLHQCSGYVLRFLVHLTCHLNASDKHVHPYEQNPQAQLKLRQALSESCHNEQKCQHRVHSLVLNKA